MKRLFIVLVVALSVAGTWWSVGSASRLSRPDKKFLTFRHERAGHKASSDAEWRIAPGTTRIGLIVGAEICGGDAFLLDRDLGVVHRADLTQGRITATIGPSARALKFVTSLAADCGQRLLYVVEHTGVVVFEMDSRAETARFAKPATFVHSIGSAVLDASARALYVPGLWPVADSDWLVKPVDRMFEGDRIGYRLDLRTGRAAPMVPAVARGCWSLGPNCLYATLDAVDGSTSARWIAAHRVGSTVGVFDAELQLVRTVDVRSQLFLETGRRNGSRRVNEMIAWNEDNSIIRRAYAFGDTLVTIHSFNRTRGWKRGKTLDFDVFMNVHTLDGAGVASDIRLPDLPVGRDATSLYVVDYGHTGRRTRGSDPFWLVKIPVAQ